MIDMNKVSVQYSLDEDVDIFDDESSWSFMQVSYEPSNIEFFSEFRDSDEFNINKRDEIVNAILCGIGCILGIFIVSFVSIMLYVRLSNDLESVNSLNNLVTVETTNKIERIDGIPQDNSVIVEVSRQLSGYFGVLKAGNDYILLDQYVKDGSRQYRGYKSYIDGIKVNYDENDCSARLLKSFARFINFGKITDVLYKDGKYYCYVTISAPTTQSVDEFIYLYQYNFRKNFVGVTPTKQSVSRYMLEMLESSSVSTDVYEYCIIMQKSPDGVFLIEDDSFIFDLCKDAFTEAIDLVLRLMTTS